MSAKDGTKFGDRGNKALSQDVVRLLKTQDAGYLRIMTQKARNEVQMLKRELHVGGNNELTSALEGGGREQEHEDDDEDWLWKETGRRRHQRRDSTAHTVYVENEEEQRNFIPEAWFGTDEEGLQRRYNRPRRSHDIRTQDSHTTVPTIESSSLSSSTQKEKLRYNKPSNHDDDANEGEEKEREDDARLFERRWRTRLANSRARLSQLEAAENELSLQRDRMAKTPTVGGVDKRGRKWRVRERKR